MELEDQGRIPGGRLLYIFFISCFLSVIMLSYFIQVIWNYINDTNFHSLFILKICGVKFGPPER